VLADFLQRVPQGLRELHGANRVERTVHRTGEADLGDRGHHVAQAYDLGSQPAALQALFQPEHGIADQPQRLVQAVR
jgi:hypothetical protein